MARNGELRSSWSTSSHLGALRRNDYSSFERKLCVRLSDLPQHEGKPWHLNTHQGRKTFARFVAKRDRTGLHALQKHFGHVSLAMTDRGYVGTDFALGRSD